MDDRQVVYVDTLEKAHQAYRAVQRSNDLLYFDTETTGLLVRSGYQDKARLIQVSVRPWDVAWAFDARTPEWREAIYHMFVEAQNVCAHNTKFDIHALETYGVKVLEIVDKHHIWDTHWLAHFHDETVSRKLKDLGVRYLRMDAAHEQAKLKRLMKKEGWTWETVPLQHLVRYGGMDTIIGGELYDYLMPRVAPYAMEPLRREQRLLPAVYAMERKGIRIDQEGLARMTAEQRDVRDNALEVLAELAEAEHVVPKADFIQKDWDVSTVLNLSSGAQVKGFFRRLGAPVPNTQAITFYKMIADEKAPEDAKKAAQALLDFKKTAKTLGTYLEAWARDLTPEGRIHPSFNTLGADTGRFSSSDPNFQNITKKGGLRNLMLPDEGKTIVVADYDQMELRMFAHFAEDERMRAAFLSGDDLYQQVSDLLGVPRDVGKMITLASQYGAGWRKTKEQAIQFAFKLGNEDQVPTLMGYDWEQMHTDFHRAYKVKSLAYRTEAAAQMRGQLGDPYILTVGGRRQRPKRMVVTNKETGRKTTISIFKDLGNSLIQGSCADIMKESIITAHEQGMELLLTVHDELVGQCPTGEEEEMGAAMAQIMTREEYVPPLTASAGWGQNYGEAK